MNTKQRLPILLVEDNPADVDLIRIYLEQVGFKFEFLHTENLFEAVDLINTREVGLTLLDLSLPDSSGFKTLTKYLERADKVPVIVLTGLNNEIIGNQAIKAGAQDFLVKGQFDAKQLGRSIRYALQRAHSHRKLEELARSLAISESRYLESQEMAHFGNWEMDIVNHSMRWSDEVYRIFGFKPGHMEPSFSDFMEYVHYDDKEAVEKFFELVSKEGKLKRIEHRLLLNGKQVKHVSLQAKLFFDDITDKVLLVGAVQDITERKLSEQLLVEKQFTSQAAQVQEEALSNLSFQIRTPMSSVVNLLFLLENTRTSMQQKEILKDLKISIDDLSIVLNNLINFSFISTGQLRIQEEEIVIRDFLAGIEKILDIKAEMAGVEFRFRMDGSLPEKVRTDPSKLSHLLYNLMEVPFHHAAEGAAIELNAGFSDEGDPGPRLEVQVYHDGPAYPEWEGEQSENLSLSQALSVPTEADQQEDKHQLSVQVVRKITGELHGELSWEFSEGRGNHIRLAIPATLGKKVRLFEGDKPDAPVHILLVEDHFLNQMATRKVLTAWSPFVQVEIAPNGKKAVEMFESGRFDLILMDIQMPVMNGIEAAGKIRENSSVPIIALTANASKHEADKCLEAGMNDYLAKPFKPGDLYAKILGLLVPVSARQG